MTGRRRGSPWRSGGSSIPLGQDVLDRLYLLPYYQEMLGKVLNSVTKKAGLGDRGIEKGDFFGFLHLSHVQPEMVFLDQQGGHHWVLGPLSLP